MKKCFLAFIILITSFCFAQNDVIVTTAGTAPIILESQRLWNNTTINTYIYKPIRGYSMQNLYVRTRSNNSGRNFTVTAFETSDSSVTGFNSSTCGMSGTIACSGYWNSISVTGTSCVSTGAIFTNGTTLNCQFLIHSTGLVALKFDQTVSGGGNGNYDLVLDFVDSSNIVSSLLFGVTSAGSLSNTNAAVVDGSGNLFVNGNLGNFPVTATSNSGANTANENNPVNSKAALMVEKSGRWFITSSPAAGVVATGTRAACGATCVNVIDCVSFATSASAVVAATNVLISVVDDTSGNAVWQLNVDIPAAAGVGQGVTPFQQCGLNIPGASLNSTMTCKFSAAVANAIESINCSGYGAN